MMTILAPGAPWPSMGVQWIRPDEPEIRESKRMDMPPTKASIMRAWLADHPWSTGTEIAEGSGLCIKLVNRSMRAQVEYRKAIFDMRYSERGSRLVKHYKLVDDALH